MTDETTTPEPATAPKKVWQPKTWMVIVGALVVVAVVVGVSVASKSKDSGSPSDVATSKGDPDLAKEACKQWVKGDIVEPSEVLNPVRNDPQEFALVGVVNHDGIHESFVCATEHVKGGYELLHVWVGDKQASDAEKSLKGLPPDS